MNDMQEHNDHTFVALKQKEVSAEYENLLLFSFLHSQV